MGGNNPFSNFGGGGNGMGDILNKVMSNPKAKAAFEKAQRNPKIMAALQDLAQNPAAMSSSTAPS